MFEDHLYWLDRLHASHRLLVGDKAFYLGLLQQKNYPVLPGLVVSAALLQSFLEQVEWADSLFADLPHSSLYVDVDNPRQLQSIAQQIRQTLQAAPFPSAWAEQLAAAVQPWSAPALILRPSIALPSGFDPTVSLKTLGFLEAKVCRPDQASIAHSLKLVWSELFRAKSLLYWQRLRIQLQQVHLAVLIQPIESAVASGDVQIDKTHLDIRAVWGLGRALTHGDVPPDFYRIDLQTGEQTSRLATKIHFYQIAADREEGTVSESVLDQGYQMMPIEPPEQTRSVLTTEQLQQLIDLAQQAATELRSHVGLEWTLLPSATAPQLYLTQIIPYLDMGRREPDHPPLQAAVTPDPHSVVPVMTGLAAAPGRIVAPAWVSPLPTSSQVPLLSGSILVTPYITPDSLPLIKHAVGMITEQGGVTSHAAVLAREMGIPAVTGVDQATQRIRTGDWLLIDGDRGEVTPISGITPAPEPQHVVSEGASDIASEPLSFLDRPSRSLPSQESPAEDMSPTVASITGTQLFVTLSQTESIAKALALPIDGVGLLRSELMLLEALQQQHPDTWIQQGRQAELTQRVVESLQTFAHSFAPHPVFYRSVDWRSDEFGHGHPPLLPDPNPALGARGSLRYQLEPALFEIELAALRQVQQQGYSNLHLILPFVRTVEEFLFCRQRVEQAGLRQNPQFQLWIMAEVPSVLLLLPDYIAAGIQGIAIGSNDLTQLLLGVDRNHPQLAAAFDQRHPAVLRAMRQIIQTARQAGIPCSLCGQAPSRHPEIIDELVRWGITAISVDLNEVVATRAAIVRAEQRLLLELAQQRLNRHPG